MEKNDNLNGYSVLKGHISNLSGSEKRTRRHGKRLATALAEASFGDFLLVVDLLFEERVEDRLRRAIYKTGIQNTDAAEDLKQITESIFGKTVIE